MLLQTHLFVFACLITMKRVIQLASHDTEHSTSRPTSAGLSSSGFSFGISMCAVIAWMDCHGSAAANFACSSLVLTAGSADPVLPGMITRPCQ